MTNPKLTMEKSDVEKAMVRTFKTDFKSLNFQSDYNICDVDKDGECVFCLQKEGFTGVGEYSYIATASLYVKKEGGNVSYIFKLSGRVSVTKDEDNAPVITFLDKIVANKWL